MPRLTRVLGHEFDGGAITVIIGRYAFKCIKSSYGDSLTPEELRFMGSQQIDAITLGGYSVEEAKLEVAESIFRGDIAPLLAQNGFGNNIEEIAVSYTHPYLGSDSDYLVDCRLIGITGGQEAGGKPLSREIKIKYRQILWTDRRLSINRIGDIPIGTLGLSML